MLTKKLELTDEVIGAINGELAYQASLHDRGRADTTDHGVAGQLVTLNVYADEANRAWVRNNNNGPALDALRKVAAIAIRALILYGCPQREIT